MSIDRDDRYRVFSPIFIGLVILIVLVGCNYSPSTIAPSQLAITITLAYTGTIKPVATIQPNLINTLIPTKTRQRATPTPERTQAYTPTYIIFPGMIGFTSSPTLDTTQLESATAAIVPQCPKIDAALELPTSLAGAIANLQTTVPRPNLSDAVIEYLNSGGAPDKFIKAMQEAYPNHVISKDLTNDGLSEIILETHQLSILGCSPESKGRYAVLGSYFDIISFGPPQILTLKDLNSDSVPELGLLSREFGGFSGTKNLDVIEWDGRAFRSVLGPPPQYPSRSLSNFWYSAMYMVDTGINFEPGSVEFQDIDNNGTIEIIINIGFPMHPDTYAHGPWRQGKDTLTWNGSAFVLFISEINPPEYRFQAVQDADQDVLIGDYEQALSLYQEAIFRDQLKGWSKELYRQQFDQNYFGDSPTLTPLPAPPDEYYHLAAYARYRIVVLHVLRGYLTEAQTVYQSLINKFPEGQPGYESVILAKSFWQEYQYNKNIGNACDRTISENASQIDEVLYWLNGDYHGLQAPNYQSVDICPFGQNSQHD